MKVIVLGAGVIGTACAYYLSKAGHEVTVVDRRSGPALETSFGNAGGSVPGSPARGPRRACRSRSCTGCSRSMHR